MFKNVTVLMRTDVAYKSVTDALGYSSLVEIKQEHSFTISVYYSALLYLLIFVCFAFQFG